MQNNTNFIDIYKMHPVGLTEIGTHSKNYSNLIKWKKKFFSKLEIVQIIIINYYSYQLFLKLNKTTENIILKK